MASAHPAAPRLGAGRSESSERRREAALGLLMAAPPIIALVLLVVLPAAQAVLFSLGRVPATNLVLASGSHIVSSDSLTLDVYRELLGSKFIRDDLALTFGVTFSAVLLTIAIAFVLALYTRFTSGPLARAARSLFLIPMFVPVVIASYALETLFANRGFIASLLSAVGVAYNSPIYHPAGIVLGSVWTSLPFATLMLSAGLDAISQDQIDAARDIGSGPLTLFLRVILPLSAVQVLIVAAFTFIGVLGSYTVPFLLGPNAPQMLGVAMNAYYGTYNQPQPALALAVITFMAAAVVGSLYVWAVNRSRRHA